jgi:SAM-dependent methyltransferase
MDDLFPAEDPCGNRKRLQFILQMLESWRIEGGLQRESVSVLDLGCGTGEYITLPLARAGFRTVGVDRNAQSIEHARSRARSLKLESAAFVLEGLVPFLSRRTERYDAIVCSEVLEHLQAPHEVLLLCRDRLSPTGILLITVPNGRGSLEIEVSIIKLLACLGIRGPLERIQHRSFRTRCGEAPVQDSFDLDSPHVQFFRHRGIRRLLNSCGFAVTGFANRTFLCGPITGKLFTVLKRLRLAGVALRLNSSVADLLPRALVAGWMLVAIRDLPVPSSPDAIHVPPPLA